MVNRKRIGERMRKLAIDCMLFFSIGGMLAYMDYPFYTWEFWVIILCVMLIQINNEYE